MTFEELLMQGATAPEMTNAMMGVLVAVLIVALIAAGGIYLCLGFAFMALGKKVKVKTPRLAWIPFIGPMIISIWYLVMVGIVALGTSVRK